MTRQPIAAVILGAFVVLAPCPAQGDSSSQKVIAEALFQDGRALFDAGRIAEACDKLQESYNADPALGTLLHLALCHETQGKTASAWSEYMRAATHANRLQQDKREELSRTRAAALKEKLSLVTLALGHSDPKGIAVALDGQSLGAAAIGTAIPMDPGTHVLVVTQQGKKTYRTEFQVDAKPSSSRVEIPPLEPEEVAPQPAFSASSALPSSSPPGEALESEKHPESKPRRTVAWSAGGVGLIAIGVGTYFGLKTFSQRDDAIAQCPDQRCTPGGMDARDSAVTSSTISTIGFGLGLAALATGAYFLFRPNSASEARPAKSSSSQSFAITF